MHEFLVVMGVLACLAIISSMVIGVIYLIFMIYDHTDSIAGLEAWKREHWERIIKAETAIRRLEEKQNEPK